MLLVKNRRSLGEVWDVPGGTVEDRETLRETLAREWLEETGLRAEVGAFQRVEDGVVRTTRGGPRTGTWRTYFFNVHCDGVPSPGEGIVEAAWIPRADVCTQLKAPYHAATRAWLQGNPIGAHPVEWVSPRPQVSERGLDGLASLVAGAASGDLDLLVARAQHQAPARTEEALLQVVPYAGFPCVIRAFGAVLNVLPPSRAETSERLQEVAARGRTTFETVYGDTADPIQRALHARHPLLAAWIREFAYGRVLSRQGVLTLREREHLAVSILTALGGLEAPLLGHMRAMGRLGASRADIERAIEAASAAVGHWRTAAARRLLERAVPPSRGGSTP